MVYTEINPFQFNNRRAYKITSCCFNMKSDVLRRQIGRRQKYLYIIQYTRTITKCNELTYSFQLQ